jgi:hypothetical protein
MRLVRRAQAVSASTTEKTAMIAIAGGIILAVIILANLDSVVRLLAALLLFAFWVVVIFAVLLLFGVIK